MKAQTSKPVVLHDGEGDATWFIGTLMTRKAGATDGVGGVAFLDQLAPAGFGPPLHVHRREDEGFTSSRVRWISSATGRPST